MTETTVASGLTVQQWDDQYFAEYVRDNRFKRYMGTSENAVIQIKEQLLSSAGESIHIPLITKLGGAGVTGNAVLEGNEEALNNYEHKITADWVRNAVVVTVKEEQKTNIGIRDAAKSALKMWSMEDLRGGTGAHGRGIIDALYSVRASGSPVLYSAASEAQKDAFLTANADRFLFGAAKGNTVSGDHSASLLNIDSTNDKLTRKVVSLAKRMAKTASPAIRPIRVSEDEEWFVMFANSLSFRDLKEDLADINKDAEVRGKDNPLYKDGDLIWDGVIIREVPEIQILSGVGAAGINVAANFLCGAQAVAVAWGQRPKSITQKTDYDFRFGCATQEMRGVEKLIFNDKQHGVVTVYASAVADA